jgi:hypothetical protein
MRLPQELILAVLQITRCCFFLEGSGRKRFLPIPNSVYHIIFQVLVHLLLCLLARFRVQILQFLTQ